MLIHFEINEESGSRRKRKMKKKVNEKGTISKKLCEKQNQLKNYNFR